MSLLYTVWNWCYRLTAFFSAFWNGRGYGGRMCVGTHHLTDYVYVSYYFIVLWMFAILVDTDMKQRSLTWVSKKMLRHSFLLEWIYILVPTSDTWMSSFFLSGQHFRSIFCLAVWYLLFALSVKAYGRRFKTTCCLWKKSFCDSIVLSSLTLL